MLDVQGRSNEKQAGESAPAAASPGKQSLEQQAAEGESEATPSLTLGRGTAFGEGGAAPAAAPTAGAAGATPAAGSGDIRVTNKNTAPGNPSMSRRRVGVGEQVELSTQGSGGTWSSTRSSTGSSPFGTKGGRSLYMWFAPDTAGGATVTYTPSGGGTARTIEMEVVAPTSVAFTNQVAMGGIVNAGAGMKNNVEVGPRDVSFANVFWKEDGGAAAEPLGVSGYFQRFARNGGDLVHHPNESWLKMNNLLKDEAGISGLPPLEGGQWSDGAFHWDIPNRYTVDDAAPGHIFATVRQGFRITQNGMVTVTKGAQSVTGAPQAAGSAIGANQEQRNEFKALLRGEGLELQLDRLRAASDEQTKQLIRDVINERRPRIFITLKCMNSYSWFGEDEVYIWVNNKMTSKGAFKMDTNQEKSDTISFWTAYDFEKFERGKTPMDITVRADGNEMKTIIHEVFRDSDFANLNKRYALKYELHGHRGSTGVTGAL